MRELTFVRPGCLEWREAPDPEVRHAEDAIVRPVASTTCDIDGMIIRGRAAEMFHGPFAIGHECIAEVVEPGPGVKGFYRGQLVVVNWHISCGRCDRCRNGSPNSCRNHPPNACYGLPRRERWGGTFSDLVRVPYANFALTPLPPGLDPVHVASAADNLPFGYELTVPHIHNVPGAPVLVMGGVGSVGLYAAMFAVAAGASQMSTPMPPALPLPKSWAPKRWRQHLPAA
jgi:threonine dehydrogenase-like Zn-dependent dehydrogenase